MSMSSQTAASTVFERPRMERATIESEIAQGRFPVDELVNLVTHAIGIPLSLAGAGLLLAKLGASESGMQTGACVLYLATLVGVFTASTLSHCFVDMRRRNFFRALDQALIYLLIIGTYTPLSLIYLKGTYWNCQLVAMWGIALAGFVSKLGFGHRVNACRIWSYLLLGVLGVIPGVAMLGKVPLPLQVLVFLGGGSFFSGIVFFVIDLRRYHFHAIWHLLVIAGCGWFWGAIYFYGC